MRLMLLLLILGLHRCQAYCGIRNHRGRAFSGRKYPAASDIPWLVSVAGNGQICEGSIIDKWWIITAASCLVMTKQSRVSGSRILSGVPGMQVDRAIIHLEYTSGPGDRPSMFDIGLILLREPLAFHQNLWPACWPADDHNLLGATHTCWILGVQALDEEPWRWSGGVSRIQVQLVEPSECLWYWPDITQQDLCARNKATTRGHCQIRRGSPLVCFDIFHTKWFLVGLVGRALKDCHGPALATRASTFTEWITRETKTARHPFYPTTLMLASKHRTQLKFSGAEEWVSQGVNLFSAARCTYPGSRSCKARLWSGWPLDGDQLPRSKRTKLQRGRLLSPLMKLIFNKLRLLAVRLDFRRYNSAMFTSEGSARRQGIPVVNSLLNQKTRKTATVLPLSTHTHITPAPIEATPPSKVPRSPHPPPSVWVKPSRFMRVSLLRRRRSAVLTFESQVGSTKQRIPPQTSQNLHTLPARTYFLSTESNTISTISLSTLMPPSAAGTSSSTSVLLNPTLSEELIKSSVLGEKITFMSNPTSEITAASTTNSSTHSPTTISTTVSTKTTTIKTSPQIQSVWIKTRWPILSTLTVGTPILAILPTFLYNRSALVVSTIRPASSNQLLASAKQPSQVLPASALLAHSAGPPPSPRLLPYTKPPSTSMHIPPYVLPNPVMPPFIIMPPNAYPLYITGMPPSASPPFGRNMPLLVYSPFGKNKPLFTNPLSGKSLPHPGYLEYGRAIPPPIHPPSDQRMPPPEVFLSDQGMPPPGYIPSDRGMSPLAHSPSDQGMPPPVHSPSDQGMSPPGNHPPDRGIQTLVHLSLDHHIQPPSSDRGMPPPVYPPPDLGIQPLVHPSPEHHIPPSSSEQGMPPPVYPPPDRGIQPLVHPSPDHHIPPSSSERGMPPPEYPPPDRGIQPLVHPSPDHHIPPSSYEQGMPPPEYPPSDRGMQLPVYLPLDRGVPLPVYPPLRGVPLPVYPPLDRGVPLPVYPQLDRGVPHPVYPPLDRGVPLPVYPPLDIGVPHPVYPPFDRGVPLAVDSPHFHHIPSPTYPPFDRSMPLPVHPPLEKGMPPPVKAPYGSGIPNIVFHPDDHGIPPPGYSQFEENTPPSAYLQHVQTITFPANRQSVSFASYMMPGSFQPLMYEVSQLPYLKPLQSYLRVPGLGPPSVSPAASPSGVGPQTNRFFRGAKRSVIATATVAASANPSSPMTWTRPPLILASLPMTLGRRSTTSSATISAIPPVTWLIPPATWPNPIPFFNWANPTAFSVSPPATLASPSVTIPLTTWAGLPVTSTRPTESLASAPLTWIIPPVTLANPAATWAGHPIMWTFPLITWKSPSVILGGTPGTQASLPPNQTRTLANMASPPPNMVRFPAILVSPPVITVGNPYTFDSATEVSPSPTVNSTPSPMRIATTWINVPTTETSTTTTLPSSAVTSIPTILTVSEETSIPKTQPSSGPTSGIVTGINSDSTEFPTVLTNSDSPGMSTIWISSDSSGFPVLWAGSDSSGVSTIWTSSETTAVPSSWTSSEPTGIPTALTRLETTSIPWISTNPASTDISTMLTSPETTGIPEISTSSDSTVRPTTQITSESTRIPTSWTRFAPSKTYSATDMAHGDDMTVILSHCGVSLEWNIYTQAFHLSRSTLQAPDDVMACGQRPFYILSDPDSLEAQAGEFPWVVSLKLSVHHFCAGSILSRWWILTTANCANIIKNEESSVMVHAGILNLQSETMSARVQMVLTHQDYQENHESHNLGLVLLQEPLHMRPLSSAICVAENMSQEKQLNLTNCWLPGWTVLQGGPTVMVKHRMDPLLRTACNSFYSGFSEFIFCMTIDEPHDTACKADIGSPLVCEDPYSKSWLQIGVLSDFDVNCRKPFVFMKLSHYMTWVERTTRQAGKPYIPPDAPWISPLPKPLPKEWDLPKAPYNPTLSVEASEDPNSLDVKAPWQSLVVTCVRNPCSGSIVSEYWILTSAACVLDIEPDDIMVYVGLRGGDHIPEDVRADRIFPHELYRPKSSSAHNIALILLRGPIIFRDDIGILSLWMNLRSNMSTVENCGLTGMRSLQPVDDESETGAADVAETNLNVQSATHCPQEPSVQNRTSFCITEPSPGVQLAKVLEGSPILCQDRVTAKWSQVGTLAHILPGVPVSAMCTTVTAYAHWINKTSRSARRPLNLPPLSSARPTLARSADLPDALLLLALALLSLATQDSC
ncbi:mucin-2-like [Pleurodeles waltl]|uniref:mucin-2-like n=1 Tax=Pleurodeles waltl TaxID=8319 RepID=UPI003709BD17